MTPPLALEIVAVTGPAWVQDAGRPGHQHEGVPPGGALVPELLAAANRSVGNPVGAAAVEAFAPVTIAARGGDLAIAWDGERGILPRDHVRVLPPPRRARVAYLAVAGGIDVPVVLGGRGLLVAAGLGGGTRRPLRGADRLPVGPASSRTAAPDVHEVDAAAPIRVVPGPDGDRLTGDAWAALVSSAWTVGTADRTGIRLEGPALPRRDDDAALSAPMVEGAIQVPGGGGPIVLGPDHPTTGGYPVIGVVIRADRGALAARGPGAALRFEEVTIAEARAAVRAWRARWGFESGAYGSRGTP